MQKKRKRKRRIRNKGSECKAWRMDASRNGANQQRASETCVSLASIAPRHNGTNAWEGVAGEREFFFFVSPQEPNRRRKHSSACRDHRWRERERGVCFRWFKVERCMQVPPVSPLFRVFFACPRVYVSYLRVASSRTRHTSLPSQPPNLLLFDVLRWFRSRVAFPFQKWGRSCVVICRVKTL